MKICLLANQMKALVLIICVSSLAFSQSIKAPVTKEESQEDLTAQRESLLNDLQILDRETLKFNDPLLEALAKVEIGEAAWQLDRGWAKKLLRRAYELSLPNVDQNQRKDRLAGSIPPMPNAMNQSQQSARRRVLNIARTDKKFISELINMEEDRLGAYGKHYASAILASQSLLEGDTKMAADYILQGIEADPTQGTAPSIISQIAMRDRSLADTLIMHYIEELRKFPINSANQSDVRTFYFLSDLLKPYLFDPVNRGFIKIPSPSPNVMRAYISYMLDALNLLEQKEPGYLRQKKGFLLSLWVPLQQYAPELAGAFLNLEGKSRRPGEKSILPTASTEEDERYRYERKVKDELKSEPPSEAVIYMTISRGDFDKARKLIDKLPDGAQKRQLSDMVNAEEALSLAAKDKVYEAEALAGKLNRAASILKVYPVLIAKCAVKKDQPCAIRRIYQALKQVKTSDASASLPPEGIPDSAIATDQRFDPVLSFIAKLSMELVGYDVDLAFEVVNELVSAANARALDTDQTRTVFDVSVFKKLAPKDEVRAQQTAYSLKNPVQRVLALAAFYQWKAKELSDKLSKSAKLN